jgi:hypothetical protein
LVSDIDAINNEYIKNESLVRICEKQYRKKYGENSYHDILNHDLAVFFDVKLQIQGDELWGKFLQPIKNEFGKKIGELIEQHRNT